ncbi:MAG: metallophosphoesterase [Stackebrandtia sp.]
MASDPPLYVASDVHGHLDKLSASLTAAELIDDDGRWCGGDARVWFLGDLFDRGADGVGVVELIMRLAEEAEAEGGRVDSLLGNHEVLMLGAQRFGDEELTDADGNPRSFQMWWHLNGGQDDDLARLDDKQLNWLRNRQAMVYAADHLLMHTDTTEYAAYGRGIQAVNRAVRKILRSNDHEKWWTLFRRLTVRHRFEAPDGPDQAAAMLDFFGGSRIVHGHSTIPDRLGIPGDEVTGPRLYCDDLVLCVDGGTYQGGPCLVVKLPADEDSVLRDADDEPEAIDIDIVIADPDETPEADEAPEAEAVKETAEKA